MANKCYLVYGGKGWIGGLFLDYFSKQGIVLVKGTARCDNYDSLKKEISEISPAHILSFIGRTHGPGFPNIDYLEQPGKLKYNIRDNLYAPLIVAGICKEFAIHLTYIGTGCIYDNTGLDSNHGFKETDDPNFFGSQYSTVNGFTSQLFRHLFKNVLHLRIRMPISSIPNSRNLITKLASFSHLHDIPNSMSIMDHIIPIAFNMMIKEKCGTYNLVNPGTISPNQIMEIYKYIVDTDKNWEIVEIKDIRSRAKRSNNRLNCTKLLKEYPNIPTIGEGLIDILGKYKNSFEKEAYNEK